MSIMNYFRKKKSANVAKDRLRIIIAQERSENTKNSHDYLPLLRQEILEVVAKYTKVGIEQVNVDLHSKDNNSTILELNVTLPDS